MAAPLISVTLPIEMTNGNTGRGTSFWQSYQRRQRYEHTLKCLKLERTPFDHPVRLRLTRILGSRQRLWDADSVLRGSAKELVDSLVAVGWFHDDGPKWIVLAEGLQDDSQRKAGPATLVEVFDGTITGTERTSGDG